MMDATEQQGLPHGQQKHQGGASPEDAPALSIHQALQALDAGRLDDAHKQLTRLLRTHSADPEVIFPLAVLRYRLGYIVSAEVLFAQAFEHGHVIHDTSTLRSVDGHPLQARWRDPTGEVQLLLAKRPRSRSMRLIKVERPSTTSPPTHAAKPHATPPTPTPTPTPVHEPVEAPAHELVAAPAHEPVEAPAHELVAAPASASATVDAALPLSDR
jgi:hypothetical protein